MDFARSRFDSGAGFANLSSSEIQSFMLEDTSKENGFIAFSHVFDLASAIMCRLL